MSSSATEAPAPTMAAAKLTARHLMSRDVLSVPPDMPVGVLAKMMAERHVSGVPVVEGASGELLGVVTEGDLIRRVAAPADPPAGWFARVFGDRERMAERYVKTHALTVRDVMTPAPLAAVEESTPAEEVARLIERRGVKRVPVLREGRLVGVVSRADLMRAVLIGPQGGEAAETDRRIEREIMALAREEPWNVARDLFVRVKDGVVELHGFCLSEPVRRALRVLAERVEGVHRVEDRMESLSFHHHGPGGT